LSIYRIVPTRSGVRIELTNSNTPNVVYHIQFSSVEGRFVGPVTLTETIAFDPFNYAFLVSFTTNLDKMVISSNGAIRQYKLISAIDTPIQCLNMAGPDHYHLMCLAGNGLHPILININTGTSQTILVSNSLIYSFEVLDEVFFYLLNMRQELLLYKLSSSSVLLVGTFTIPPGVNFRPIHYNRGTLNCSDHITANTNQDYNNNQTNNANNQTDHDTDQTNNNNDQPDNDNDQTNYDNQNDSQTNNSYQGENQTSNNNQSGSNNSGGQANHSNRINVTDQDHSNNQSNSNNNQINISNQTNSNVVAIVIGAIFITVCGAITMYGLKKWQSSSRQKLETYSKETILQSRVKPVIHDSPKCQRPQRDTAPHNGEMIVRQIPPKAIKKSSCSTTSEEETKLLWSEKDYSNPLSRLVPEAK